MLSLFRSGIYLRNHQPMTFTSRTQQCAGYGTYRLASPFSFRLLVFLRRIVARLRFSLGTRACRLVTAIVLGGFFRIDRHLICHVPPKRLKRWPRGGKRLDLTQKRGEMLAAQVGTVRAKQYAVRLTDRVQYDTGCLGLLSCGPRSTRRKAGIHLARSLSMFRSSSSSSSSSSRSCKSTVTCCSAGWQSRSKTVRKWAALPKRGIKRAQASAQISAASALRGKKMGEGIRQLGSGSVVYRV